MSSNVYCKLRLIRSSLNVRKSRSPREKFKLSWLPWRFTDC